MIDDNLKNWIIENKLAISESIYNGSDIISIQDWGNALYLKPFEGKIIDEDFAFILSEDEFDIINSGKVNYILFEFGKRFYYSNIKSTRNKYNEVIYKPEFNDFKYLGKTIEPFICNFSHLGVHSEYEILNGSGNCDIWARKAHFIGCKSLGICDKNSLAGSLPFQSACEKYKIKSIIGETIVVAFNYSKDVDIQETFELKLYVKNDIGWKNLLLINKIINVDYKGFIPSEELYKHGKGLICVICKESYFNHIIEQKNLIFDLIKQYNKYFSGVYYQIDTVEYISNQLFKQHLSNIDMYITNYKDIVKPIVINDSYYLDKDECKLKGMLNKIAGKVYGESNNQYFKSVIDTLSSYNDWLDDVKPLFDVIMVGIRNTTVLSDKIDFVIKTDERKLPKFEVNNVEDLFFQELEKGFNEILIKVPLSEHDRYKNQISKECDVIVPNGLIDYFMILWDIINWCHKNNITTGIGRGSVCGSLVAYCLHITDVDPLKYNLMFERFLNETRVKAPEVYEITLENGDKVDIPIDGKLTLNNGDIIDLKDLDNVNDLCNLDIDLDKLNSK